MNTLTSIFKALSDPLRLRILEKLPTTDRCEDVYNVSELAVELKVSQPTISHHLRILRHADIVKCRRMCHDVYYWINLDTLALCSAALLKRTFEMSTSPASPPNLSTANKPAQPKGNMPIFKKGTVKRNVGDMLK